MLRGTWRRRNQRARAVGVGDVVTENLRSEPDLPVDARA
jgi:hypothetical protein